MSIANMVAQVRPLRTRRCRDLDLVLQLRSLLLWLPKLCVCLIVFENGKHSLHEVINQVAVKCPDAGVIRIKGHSDL